MKKDQKTVVNIFSKRYNINTRGFECINWYTNIW